MKTILPRGKNARVGAMAAPSREARGNGVGAERPLRLSAKNKKQRAHRGGLRAELFALLYMSLKGYWLVSWRYKTPVGEIDLILRRGRTLAFVEVKARADKESAAHAIHLTNQSRVVRAAQYFLQAHPNYAGHEMRFDAVLIAWYRRPIHLPNAFTA